MRMKAFFIVTLFTMLMLVPLGHGVAAQSVYASVETRQPVMVLRFNQRNVHYEKHLASIIRRAQQIKPDVKFDLVSILPATGDRDFWQRKSTAQVNQLMRSFANNGIAAQRIETSQKMAAVSTDEIHIFVR